MSTLFIGEYEHTIDPKSRIIMPSKFREDIGEKFVVTKSLEGCLLVYSLEEWKSFEEKLRTLPTTDKNINKFIRIFFAGAIECELDKQGRFLISAKLKEYAELEKDVVIIGVSSKLEIWSKDKWENYNSSENISEDEIAEKMALLGI